jgi:two-component system OmpR family sensor kinase
MGVAELALLAAQKAEGGCPPRVLALLERLQHLVQDYMKRATRLLDISRMEAGNLLLQSSHADLSTLVHSVAERYEAEAAHQHCVLERDIEDGISAECDSLAMEQVIENLLSNALKFGAGKPVSLRLRADKSSVWVEVQDRGIGMSGDQQARIFGRFEQVVTNHSGSGFGLGLWIANGLITAMDGRLNVASRPGEGSIFQARLRLSPPNIGSHQG